MSDSTDDFEFRFFVEHGYMPNASQKKANENRNIKNTKSFEAKKTENSIEDDYAEFEAALGIKKTRSPKVRDDIYNTHADFNSGYNNDHEASREENYAEFEEALGMDRVSTKNRKNDKNTEKPKESNHKEAIKKHQDIRGYLKNNESFENVETKARLYSQFVNSIERESISIENIGKIDSPRKSKNHYATKKPSKNQICPEDRIDLHGDTQSIAKSRLINFINRSKAKGYSQILVIHGKGLHNANKIAVLKDMVECFAQTDGRHLIKSMIEAPPNLGGSGAKIMWI